MVNSPVDSFDDSPEITKNAVISALEEKQAGHGKVGID